VGERGGRALMLLLLPERGRDVASLFRIPSYWSMEEGFFARRATEREGWPPAIPRCAKKPSSLSDVSLPPRNSYDDAAAGNSSDGRLLRTMGSSRMASTMPVARIAQAPAV
jgi:hypothetical protein